MQRGVNTYNDAALVAETLRGDVDSHAQVAAKLLDEFDGCLVILELAGRSMRVCDPASAAINAFHEGCDKADTALGEFNPAAQGPVDAAGVLKNAVQPLQRLERAVKRAVAEVRKKVHLLQLPDDMPAALTTVAALVEGIQEAHDKRLRLIKQYDTPRAQPGVEAELEELRSAGVKLSRLYEAGAELRETVGAHSLNLSAELGKAIRRMAALAIDMSSKRDAASQQQDTLQAKVASSRYKGRDPNPFYQRAAELDDVIKLLKDSAVNVFVYGPPGAGKTMLIQALDDEFMTV